MYNDQQCSCEDSTILFAMIRRIILRVVAALARRTAQNDFNIRPLFELAHENCRYRSLWGPTHDCNNSVHVNYLLKLSRKGPVNFSVKFIY